MTCIIDTNSINLTVAAGQLSADVILDPASGIAPNPLVINAAGLYAQGADGWLPLPVTLAYSSADGHTFVATTSADLTAFIGPGDRIRLTQSATVKYFIVTAITGSTITLYGGTDYALANAAITLPSFSKSKSPAKFPLDPIKWTEVVTGGGTQVSPVTGTWYNAGSPSIDLPIGSWDVQWAASVGIAGTANTTGNGISGADATLSTANNSESDSAFTAGHYHYYGVTNASALERDITEGRRKIVTVAVKTTYYLNTRCSAQNSFSTVSVYSTGVRIAAVCAYL
jgi:hypothetical protein